jgi:ribonucleoside-diphosphate reductase alpha chain
VIQQGGSRRGALMVMLDDDHPDIEEFVTVKRDLSKLNGANLSVCVSDRFMAAVEADAPWPLRWQGETHKTLPARELWALICESAHASGEPGLVFMERYQKLSNTAYCETIISVNPCGEQGLPAYGVCNLGAMNLAAYASGPIGAGVFDFPALEADTAVAVRFLDSVVDATGYFFPENEAAQKRVRRTGLGTMGLADALLRMGLRYGSTKAEPFVERVYKTIRDSAYAASAELAGEKGAFPAYDADHYLERPFVRALPEAVKKRIRRHGIRNAVLLTQAPTGTTSLVAGVSSGIEPVYDFAMVRRDRTGESVMYHPLLEEWRKANPPLTPLPDSFVSANDLTPDEHVTVQALIQRYTDSSISKTVNAPNAHTVAQVQELYLKAYRYGCKGVTYFRDGCREGVLSHLEPTTTLTLAPTVVVTTGALTAATNGAATVASVVVPVARRRPCPECGEATLADAEGCEHCPACGYAACAL